MAEQAEQAEQPHSHLDDAKATMVLCLAQHIKNVTIQARERFRREMAEDDRIAEDKANDQKASLPIKKRNLEFEDEQHKVTHTMRMEKLQREADNTRRTRDCAIDRKTRKMDRYLHTTIRNDTLDKELNIISEDQTRYTKEIEYEQSKLDRARKMAELHRVSAEKIEDERLRQKLQEANQSFELRKLDVKRRKLLSTHDDDIATSQANLDLFKQYGYSIPPDLL